MPGSRRPIVFLLAALGCARGTAPAPEHGRPDFHPEPRADPLPVVAVPPSPLDEAPPLAGRLPEVPAASGPLRIDVVYPGAGTQVAASDSTFLLGSVGRGTATLRIDGRPVPVAANGAWLAWVPLPSGPAALFRLEAVDGGDTVRLALPVRLPASFVPPTRGPWIDTTSFLPAGTAWWPASEYLSFSVRAAPAARVSLVLPGGRRVPLAPIPGFRELPPGLRAFDRDTLNLRRPLERDRHQIAVRGLVVGDSPGALLPEIIPGPGAAPLWVEAVQGRDTVRARWPIRLALTDTVPILVEVDDDLAGEGGTDRVTPARALPGATYHWFLPAGTRMAATARLNGDLRVELSPGQSAWVPAAEVRLLARGVALGPATAGPVTVTPLADRVRIRIPVGQQVPIRVDEEPRRLILTLYRSAGDPNWIRYGGGEDTLLREIAWSQAGPDVAFVLSLGEPVWGYRAQWEQGDLLLDIRRPPEVDPTEPMAGRIIAVDPGHPPGGSTGPTRLTEADANLMVARRLAELLAEAGATVVMTRGDSTPVGLWPRVRDAEAAGAELLVSIHNNALPDGVNPFTNSGTSTFYNHPRSLPLARAIQAALVRRTGLRDLGVARGDLAVVRTTWMPSVLAEGLFMIVPEHEAALRSVEGQERYAAAVFEGIRDFLLWRSGAGRTSPR